MARLRCFNSAKPKGRLPLMASLAAVSLLVGLASTMQGQGQEETKTAPPPAAVMPFESSPEFNLDPELEKERTRRGRKSSEKSKALFAWPTFSNPLPNPKLPDLPRPPVVTLPNPFSKLLSDGQTEAVPLDPTKPPIQPAPQEVPESAAAAQPSPAVGPKPKTPLGIAWPTFPAIGVGNKVEPSATSPAAPSTASQASGITATQVPSGVTQPTPLEPALNEDPQHLSLRFERNSVVFAPNEKFQCHVAPQRVEVLPNQPIVCRVQLCLAGLNESFWQFDASATAYEDGTMTEAGPFVVPLPSREGVYDLVVSFDKREGDRNSPGGWAYRRRFQLVVVSNRSSGDDKQAAWELLQEVDLIRPANDLAGWGVLTQLPFLEEFARNKSTPTDAAAGVGHGIVRPRSLGSRQGTEMAGGGWRAVPLPVNPVGGPHVLEIDYPTDQPISVALAIIEPSQPSGNGATLDRGFEVLKTSVDDSTNRWSTHRFVFWPTTHTPWLVVANRNPARPATVGAIRLYGGEQARLHHDTQKSAPGDRVVGVQLDEMSLLDAFAGGLVTQPNQASATSWQTWLDAGSHATQYLRHVGYNGLSIPVVHEGGALYPSRHVQHYLDPQRNFSAAGPHDPLPKDVVELLLRQCDREGIRLNLQVGLTARLPELEAAAANGERGILLVPPADLSPQHRAAWPRYNTLHPTVQRCLGNIVRELAQRYGAHPACGGIAVQLAPESYATLAGELAGADELSFGQFLQDESIEIASASKLTSRDAVLTLLRNDRKLHVKFERWRNKTITKFYGELAGQLAARQPSVRFSLVPRGRYASAAETLEVACGLDRDTLRKYPHLEVTSTQSLASSASAESAAPFAKHGFSGDELASQVSTDSYPAVTDAWPTALVYHEAQEFKLAGAKLVTAGVATPELTLKTQPSRSSDESRRVWLERLAAQDVQVLWQGGALPPFGCEEAVRDLVQAWRQLPAVPFESWRNAEGVSSAEPVVVRATRYQGRLYLYLVNDRPQSQSVRVQFEGSEDVPLQNLMEGELPPVVRNGQHWDWKLTLPAYSLISVVIPHATCQITACQAEADPAELAALRQRLDSLRAATDRLQSLPTRVVNSDFEQPLHLGKIPGWHPESSAESSVRLETQPDGGQVIRLQSNATSTDAVAQLSSDPILVSGGTSWVLAVHARVVDPAPEQVLRVALELKTGSETMIQSREFGQSKGTAELTPIGSDWTRLEFPLEDVPPDVRQVRCTFALRGGGEVWVDDVELSRENRSKMEQARLQELWQQVAGHLAAGRVVSARKILSGAEARQLLAADQAGMGLNQLRARPFVDSAPNQSSGRVIANATQPNQIAPAQPVQPNRFQPPQARPLDGIRVGNVPARPFEKGPLPMINTTPQTFHSSGAGPVVRIGTPNGADNAIRAGEKEQKSDIERLPPVEATILR